MTKKPAKEVTPDILTDPVEDLEKWLQSNFHSISHTESFGLLLDRLKITEHHRDQYLKRRADLVSDHEVRREKYQELLHSVESKFPGETRHETALRYIREQESKTSAAKVEKE